MTQCTDTVISKNAVIITTVGQSSTFVVLMPSDPCRRRKWSCNVATMLNSKDFCCYWDSSFQHDISCSYL